MGLPITEYKEEVHVFGTEENLGHPPNNVMLVFEENGVVKGVEYLCPCGCGHSIYTPTHTPKTEHHWEFSRGPNGPTLSPSIRWLSGCLSHFTIKDGKVKME